MEFSFKHSLVVMGQLAQDAARTPPSEDDPPLEYVDQSLTILGRTFDTHNQRIRQEFLGQRDFIASQFREVEKKTNERLGEMEKKMDGRFKEVDGRFEEMNKLFQKIDRRFDRLESEIRDIKVQIENAAAVTRNGRLRRMHQSINLIKVLKPGDKPNNFVWASHPRVPKHMKDTYILGQHAKGIFEPSWDGKPDKQSMHFFHLYAKCFFALYLAELLFIVAIDFTNVVFIEIQAEQKALHTINELAKFYNIIIFSDDESESDATEVMLRETTVDDYMEALLDEWGMDWQKVLRLGMQHMQAQSQQAGAKRAGDASSRGEPKKARGDREEEAD